MLYKKLRQDPFAGVGMDQGPSTPWYSSLYTNNPTTAGYHPTLQLCDYWEQEVNNLTGGGNYFQYAYLDISVPESGPADLSAGVWLTDAPPGTDTVSALLTDAVTGQVYGITLVTGGLTPNAEVGNILYMADIGVQKVILANTATDLIFSLRDTLPNGLDANAIAAGGGPAGSSDITIIRPGHVIVGGNTAPAVGVLLNDITEGTFIVMQIMGEALMLGSNANAALVAGFPATIQNSGLISGTAGGGPVAGQGDGVVIPYVNYDSVTVARVPVQFKATGF